MEEKSVKAGDFDAKSKGPKGEIRQYFLHGLPFVLMTSMIVISAQLILNTFSSLINLIVISVFDAPDIITSPFASSIVLLILLFFGTILIAFFNGTVNRVLTERIWHEKQNRQWDRQIGQGFMLLSTLCVIHLPLFPFYVLWVSGLVIEQALFLIIYLPVMSFIDGVLAKFLATLQFD